MISEERIKHLFERLARNGQPITLDYAIGQLANAVTTKKVTRGEATLVLRALQDSTRSGG